MQSDPLLWLLVLFSGALLLSAAPLWLKLSRHTELIDERPQIPVSSFRYAASVTGFGLGALGAALLWIALTKL